MFTVHGHGWNAPPSFRPVSVSVIALRTETGTPDCWETVVATDPQISASLALALHGDVDPNAATIKATQNAA
jgi:hypothetical protein